MKRSISGMGFLSQNVLRPFVLLLFTSICINANAQADTNYIYNASALQPGYYRTYQDYLHNSPIAGTAVQPQQLYIKNGRDSILIGARLPSNKNELHGAWGYCDQKNVYVALHISLFKKRFIALQYVGKNPFLLYWHEDIFTLGQQRTDSIVSLPYYHLMYIDDEGKIRKATVKRLKNLLAADPALLKRFRMERDYNLKILTEYLVRYNELFMKDN